MRALPSGHLVTFEHALYFPLKIVTEAQLPRLNQPAFSFTVVRSQR